MSAATMTMKTRSMTGAVGRKSYTEYRSTQVNSAGVTKTKTKRSSKARTGGRRTQRVRNPWAGLDSSCWQVQLARVTWNGGVELPKKGQDEAEFYATHPMLGVVPLEMDEFSEDIPALDHIGGTYRMVKDETRMAEGSPDDGESAGRVFVVGGHVVFSTIVVLW